MVTKPQNPSLVLILFTSGGIHSPTWTPSQNSGHELMTRAQPYIIYMVFRVAAWPSSGQLRVTPSTYFVIYKNTHAGWIQYPTWTCTLSPLRTVCLRKTHRLKWNSGSEGETPDDTRVTFEAIPPLDFSDKRASDFSVKRTKLGLGFWPLPLKFPYNTPFWQCACINLFHYI